VRAERSATYSQRMERRTRWTRLRGASHASGALLGVVVLLTGCTHSSVPESSNGPTGAPTLKADVRGTMTVTPAAAEAGQEVSLRFSPDNVRGIAFSLSSWQDGTWTPLYFLTSDWGKPSYHPGWWRIEDSEDRGWEQVAIEGDGPDRVVVPDAAAPGAYMLCTANAVDEACALVTVTG
jgi:hypothetical protein